MITLNFTKIMLYSTHTFAVTTSHEDVVFETGES